MKRRLLFVSFIIASLFAGIKVNAQILFVVTDPPAVAGPHDFSPIDATLSPSWGVDMDTVFVHEQLVVVHDGTADDTLGCNPLINGPQLAGKIAVVYRGICEFGMKAKNAQNAGAVGVIIINHTPGDGLINMLPGDSGGLVTIPVVFITYETGQLLRPYIDAGTAVAMMGNKTGVFANDLGAFRPDIVIPNSWAVPNALATNASAFEVPVGGWITNYGTNPQSNVTLTATVSFGGNVIYNQTSAGVTIASGDSTLIDNLPVFSQSSYPDGLYSLEYTINSGTTDDFPFDNVIRTHFWIQPDFYSKSRFDTLTMEPITTNFYRTSDVVDEFMWCTVLDHPDSGNLTAYGVSFSATAASTSTLANKSIQVHLFEWNDVIVDTMTFDNLNSLIEDQYKDYIDDSESGQFVTVWFKDLVTQTPTPIQLSNNTKYLTCVKTFDTDVFIGSDDVIDYETAWDAYNPSSTQFDDLSVFFPIRGTVGTVHDWNGVGFGSSPAPAIILHTSNIVGIEESIANDVIFPYPNPGNDFINVSLKKVYNGKVTVDIYDITGRTVKSEVVNMNNSHNFRVSTFNLTNGMYQLNIKFSDNSVANFPFVIAR